jgi:hypothetical protein
MAYAVYAGMVHVIRTETTWAASSDIILLRTADVRLLRAVDSAYRSCLFFLTALLWVGHLYGEAYAWYAGMVRVIRTETRGLRVQRLLRTADLRLLRTVDSAYRSCLSLLTGALEGRPPLWYSLCRTRYII